MMESHEPPYAGHRGKARTLFVLERHFYWPSLRKYIFNFVEQCLTCQKVKFDKGKTPGLLQPLPIPNKPWESITMDFILGIPRSIHGNNQIWVIVDRFSKQVLPYQKTLKGPAAARMFIKYIFVHHGLPTEIISDRDPRFTSNF